MAVTLNMPPDLESRVRDEAAKAGLATDAFILRELERRLGTTPTGMLGMLLSQRETELLRHISLGISTENWKRRRELRAKNDAEILTPQEHAELVAINELIERRDARRMGPLADLAQLRGVSLLDLMKSLGIRPGSEDPTEPDGSSHG